MAKVVMFLVREFSKFKINFQICYQATSHKTFTTWTKQDYFIECNQLKHLQKER
jgi:hypothetical protein